MFLRSFLVFLFAFTLLAVGGCKPEWQTAPPERFKLVVTQDGRALRLDTQSGEVALVTDKRLIILPVTNMNRAPLTPETARDIALGRGLITPEEAIKRELMTRDDAIKKGLIRE
jgi:hypothetical protein